MARRKIIIILSRVYPRACSCRNEPTGFEDLLKSGVKKHAIRKNYDQWQHNAELMKGGRYYLSVRQPTGTSYRPTYEEIARIDTPMEVSRITLTYHPEDDTITALVDGHATDVAELAKNDGLPLQTLKEWFFSKAMKAGEQAVFNGGLVYFGSFRYGSLENK